jgi:hypothetical protein
MSVLRSPLYSPLYSPLRSPLTRLKGGGGGGIRPPSASIVYTSASPTLTGVIILFAAGEGASISFAGGLAPNVLAPAVVVAGEGASVVYAGGDAPTGLGVPDGVIRLRNGDYVIDRAGDYIINIPQAA